MGRIKNNNYYVTNGWMINDLGLTGRELQVYAIIYGFTQDDETEFNGSITYIAEWLGTSNRGTVTRAITGLIDKGLIAKRQTGPAGAKINYFKAIIPPPDITASTETVLVPKQYQPSTKTVLGASAETVPEPSTETVPDIYINNNNNKYIYNSLSQETEKSEEADPVHAEKSNAVPYEKIRKAYNDLCQAFPKCISLSENRKKAIAARWKEYGQSMAPFVTLFTQAEASSFLKGKNDRNWSATFDWLLKSANMAKVLEGNYRDKGGPQNHGTAGKGTPGTSPSNGTSGTTPATVRTVTQSELEAKLRREGVKIDSPDFAAILGTGADRPANGCNDQQRPENGQI